MDVTLHERVPGKYCLWKEGGTLFVGPAEAADVPTVLAAGSSCAALRRIARRLIVNDPTDRRFPGGLLVVG